MNSVKEYKAFAYLDLNKITPKMILMIVLFMVTLAVYTLGVYLQNKKSQEVIHRVEKIRIPVRAAVNEILIGTNRLATAQRGYFMSSDEKYKKERQEIWQNSIEKPMETLKDFQASLTAEEQQAINQVSEKLLVYKSIQDNLEKYYDENILPIHLRLKETINGDSVQKATFDDLIRKEKLDQEIHELISQKSRTLRQEYQKLLQYIKDAQERDLHADTENINEEIMLTNAFAFGTMLIAATVWIILGYYISRSLRRSIQKPVDMLQKLQMGELTEAVKESKDELNSIIVAGNQVIENLRNASSFAKDIGEGNFDHPFTALSENDVLGNSLVQMRDKLLRVAQEDQKRNWITQGLAELGEILRKTDHSSPTFYSDVLTFIVKYVSANQGGLFVNKNSELELVGCYAFNRKKYLHKSIKPGEGLVGQTYLEKEPIFLKQVPDDYLTITSGLGDAPPRCILICPLIMKDEVYGVLELASFTVFEEHHKELIDKISEQLASVIASTQISHHTTRLLSDSQQKTEELRAQEEEMRQNMEELSATQEEMHRVLRDIGGKEQYLNELINVPKDSIFTLDRSFKVLTFNKSFSKSLEALGIVVEKGFAFMQLFPDATQKEKQIKLYERAFAGENFEQIEEYAGQGESSYYLGNYAPLYDANKQIFAVACFTKDITEMMRAKKQADTLLIDSQEKAEILQAQEEEMRQNLEEISATQEELARKEQQYIQRIQDLETRIAELSHL